MDIQRLRRELIDYYGTASMQFPMAMAEVIRVENASEEELIQMGLDTGILTIVEGDEGED